MTEELTATLPALLIIGAASLAALSGMPMIVRGVNPRFGQRCARLFLWLCAIPFWRGWELARRNSCWDGG